VISKLGSTAPADFTENDMATPDACQDGNQILFFVPNAPGIRRMDANGNNITQLTSGSNDLAPLCSPDSKWVYYDDITAGNQKIMKVALAGGTPQCFSELAPTGWFALSPDGKLLAIDVSAADNSRLAIVSTDSGKTVSTFKPDKPLSERFQFTPDSRSIAYPIREAQGSALWAPATGRLAGKIADELRARFDPKLSLVSRRQQARHHPPPGRRRCSPAPRRSPLNRATRAQLSTTHRSFSRTRGLRSILRMYPAFMPCSATIQNCPPMRPLPTGVRRGFPLLRPMVSRRAYPGAARPTANISLMGGLSTYFCSA
jgi:hypothetical protein